EAPPPPRPHQFRPADHRLVVRVVPVSHVFREQLADLLAVVALPGLDVRLEAAGNLRLFHEFPLLIPACHEWFGVIPAGGLSGASAKVQYPPGVRIHAAFRGIGSFAVKFRWFVLVAWVIAAVAVP